MADEQRTLLEQLCQFNQSQTLRKPNTRRENSHALGQPMQTLAFGFSADEQQLMVGCLNQMVQQIGPFVFRPILLIASAAGMKSEVLGRGFRVEREARDWVGIENRQLLERFEIDSGCVKPELLIGPMRPGDELREAATPNICLKNL